MSWNSSTMIERKRSCSRSRIALVVAEEVARRELEILEVERRLARPSPAAYALANSVEQLLEQVAVARGGLVERRLLDAPPRVLVSRGALAARPRSAERSSSRSGGVSRLEELERLRVAAALRRRSRPGRRRAQRRRPPRSSATPLAELAAASPSSSTSSRPAGAQRLVDAGQHPAQPAAPYVASSRSRSGSLARAELGERGARTPRARSTAAWLSSSSRKRGSSPAANGYARSSRLQKPWIVEIQAPSSSRARSCRPRSASARADPRAQLARGRARCR